MKKWREKLVLSACVLATVLMMACSTQTPSGSGESTAAQTISTAQTSEESTEEAQTESTAAAQAKGILRMATTTSTADTGLLDYLAPIFLAESGWELQWTAVGTGEALKMGENGDVDVVLVHSKASEEKFVEEGFGVERFQVMYNDFVVVGPSEPIAHNEDVLETFKIIREKELPFVSRGDDSGTHKKELKIWEALEADPAGNPNYVESGQGMGASLTMADEKNAYCLTDRGTWLKMKNDADATFRIDVVCEGAKDLLNQYGVIAVNPEKYPEVNAEAADAFITWICSEKTQNLIAEYGVEQYGQALFTPNAN